MSKETSIITINSKNQKKKKVDSIIDISSCELFPKTGKQGLVGLINDLQGNRLIFKISQKLNCLVDHEFSVMSKLLPITEYCRHFPKVVCSLTIKTDGDIRHSKNPFKSKSKYKISNEILLMEYINSSRKFYRYLKKKVTEDEVILSIVKQVLLAVHIAQKEAKLVHYDLHSNNIMIKKCGKDDYFLYILDENTQILVKTYGYYPVIIDFGFSHTEMEEGENLYCPLTQTDIGFIPCNFDPLSDAKLFLITVSHEFLVYRDNKISDKFRKIVENIFSPLKIDWESGWDDSKGKSVSEELLDVFLTLAKDKSKLFSNEDYIYQCVEILECLITYPLEEGSYNDEIVTSFLMFLKEFIKIEVEIGSCFYSLYILKGMVLASNSLKDKYFNKDSRKEALNLFREKVYSIIDSISSFCMPKELDCENLLFSLYALGKYIERLASFNLKKKLKSKEREYSKMKVKDVLTIFKIVDANFRDKYELNEESVIKVCDCINKKESEFKIDGEFLEEVNSVSGDKRGELVYEIYKSNN